MLKDLILLTIIIVYIVDLSGFMDSVKHALGKWLNLSVRHLPPFDCSLCMTWWIGLIYLIITSQFTLLNIAIVALLSLLALPIGGAISFLIDLFSFIITQISNLINHDQR